MDKDVKHGAVVMALKRLKPDVNYQINERIKKNVDPFKGGPHVVNVKWKREDSELAWARFIS